MKKTLLTILSMVLCLSLQAAVTLDFTNAANDWGIPSGSSSGLKGPETYTNGTYSITLCAADAYYFNSQGYLMLGKSGSYLTLPTVDFAVGTIVVGGKSGASANTVMNIYVDDTAVSTACTSSQEDHTYVIDSNYQTVGTTYTFKITNAYNAQITSITIYGVDEEVGSDQPSGHGYEADDPYTVSELIPVIEALSSGGTVSGVYVKGIVSEITEISTSYGNMTYYISDDGTTDNQLLIYRGKSLNNAGPETDSDIKVSDIVVVYGTFVNYSGNTPEGQTGNTYIYSLEEGDGNTSGTTIGGLETFENGSFEEWDGDYPVGWKSTTSASNHTLTQSTDAQEGTYSVQIPLNTSTNQRLASKEFLLPAATYTISFYAKSADEEGQAHIAAGYAPWDSEENKMGTYVYSDYYDIPADEWTNITWEFTLDEETQVNLVVMNQHSGTSAVLIDNYSIVEGSVAGGVTHHENDYLTPEIMGFNLETESKQTITYDGAPSGTEYQAYCYVGSGDYYGDFNISAAADYLRNNTSVGYLRELIIEPDENYVLTHILSVRVANEPYTGSKYSDFSSYGTEIAQIPVIEGGTVDIDGDYEYFAIGGTSDGSQAKRFKSIELIWEVEGAAVPQVTFDPESGTTHSELSEFTVICEEGLGFNENSAISITRDGEELDIYVNAWEITDGTKATMDFSTDEWGEYPTSLTEAGEYVITIPAKFFILGDDEVESKELTVTYIIEESSTGGVPEGYIIDPEDGSTIESLYKINVAYDGGNVTVDSSLDKSEEVRASFKVVNDATGKTVATIDHYEGVKDDNGYQTYDIYFTDEITTSGTYTVTIPASVFYDPDYAACPEFYLHYTVEPKSIDGYYFTPADGKTVESLYTIKVEHECGSMGASGLWDEDVEAEFKVVNDLTGETVATLGSWEQVYDDDDYRLSWVELTLSEEITAAGTYTVTIPEGAFMDYSSFADSPAFTLHYTIEGDVYGTFDYTVDPAEGEVESLQVIKLFSETLFWGGDTFYPVFDGTVSIYKDGDSEPYATTTNIGDEYDYSVAAWAPAYLIITFEEAITEEGDYEVVIPAGTFLWYNDEDMINNEEIRLSYTIKEDAGTETGINGISINDENVEGIYSVGGQKLNKTVKGVNIVRYTDGSVKKIYIK